MTFSSYRPALQQSILQRRCAHKGTNTSTHTQSTNLGELNSLHQFVFAPCVHHLLLWFAACKQ